MSSDEIIFLFPTHQTNLLLCFLTYAPLIHLVAQVRDLDGVVLEVVFSLIPLSNWRANSIDPVC